MRRFILSLLLIGSAAEAARRHIDRPTLCSMAEVVVIGEVTGQEVLWSAGEPGGLETHSDLSVTQTVRADRAAPTDTLTVITPGGVRDGIRLTIEDAAALRTDHRYLLLLSPYADGFRVVGGADGAIPLGHTEPAAEAIASLGGCRAN